MGRDCKYLNRVLGALVQNIMLHCSLHRCTVFSDEGSVLLLSNTEGVGEWMDVSSYCLFWDKIVDLKSGMHCTLRETSIYFVLNKSFKIFWPHPPLVFIRNWFMFYNSCNLPNLVCFSMTPLGLKCRHHTEESLTVRSALLLPEFCWDCET